MVLWVFCCLLLPALVFAKPWLPPAYEDYPFGNNPEENEGLFEGDMVFDDMNFAAIIKPSKLWPGGVVPYVVTQDQFSDSEKDMIKTAIGEYDKHTCIRWVKRTNEASYVKFEKHNGCWSHVGQTSKTKHQVISLASGCFRLGTVIHEMMHAIGFHHEQCRYDRDDHVTVMYENIRDANTHNFNKYSNTQIQHLETNYDYSSVMHYPKYAFSKNGRPTIVPKVPGVTIGQRAGFSYSDILRIKRLYNNCEAKMTTARIQPTTRPIPTSAIYTPRPTGWLTPGTRLPTTRPTRLPTTWWTRRPATWWTRLMTRVPTTRPSYTRQTTRPY